jgi:hypothetical protein
MLNKYELQAATTTTLLLLYCFSTVSLSTCPYLPHPQRSETTFASVERPTRCAAAAAALLLAAAAALLLLSCWGGRRALLILAPGPGEKVVEKGNFGFTQQFPQTLLP